MKRVSICMATYNGEKYIYEQVKSILDQLSNNDELIISDDDSSDATIFILKSFKDDRIKIFTNDGKKGPVGNFENALTKATGDIIFLADQDDYWYSNKIATMVSYLQNYDVVNCDCEIVDENLKIICPSYFAYINSGAGFFKNLKRNTYMGNSMAFKRKIIDIALPFPTNIPNHDLWIGAIADIFFKPYFIAQILGMHRRHQTNASNTFDIKIKTSLLTKINKRVILFRHLPKVFIRVLKLSIKH